MGLESTTDIDGLDNTWPASGDVASQGDDHIRLVKTVLKIIFPGSGGNGFSTPIFATEADLNYCQGLTSNAQTQLNTLTASVASIGSVPIGGIIMYNGAFASIPITYALCDGTGGTPDLTDKFIYGTNTELELGDTGGSADAIVVSHTHTFVGTPMGTHEHSLQFNTTAHSTGENSPNAVGTEATKTTVRTMDSDHKALAVSAGTPAGTNSSTGSSGTGANIPPYLKLAFIRRMS